MICLDGRKEKRLLLDTYSKRIFFQLLANTFWRRCESALFFQKIRTQSFSEYGTEFHRVFLLNKTPLPIKEKGNLNSRKFEKEN
jgi:hypothetical protein